MDGGHYARLPNFVLGFHGCDQAVADAVIARQEPMKVSENDYDWLGTGIYFWENDSQRALEWARSMQGKPRKHAKPIEKPAVIGAVIDLGNCLNFLEQLAVTLAQDAYQRIVDDCQASGMAVPTNVNHPRMTDSRDKIYRRLDCAVVNRVHVMAKELRLPAFDSVRAVFLEGKDLYQGSGFRAKTHIQICVTNHRKIIGTFHPRLG